MESPWWCRPRSPSWARARCAKMPWSSRAPCRLTGECRYHLVSITAASPAARRAASWAPSSRIWKSRINARNRAMYQASSEQHRRIVAAVVRSAVKPSKSMRNLDWPRFVRAYYASVDAQDLASREPTELAAAALSHLTFASRRRRTALVRGFNPTLREHGYTSPHTVIEMVNDDMPFLVDSINLALTQRALTLHFLTHPIFAVVRDASGNLQSL